MSDKKILDMGDLDFELPPLPVRPVSVTGETSAALEKQEAPAADTAQEKSNTPHVLPPLENEADSKQTVEDTASVKQQEESISADDDLPPLKVPAPAKEAEEDEKVSETALSDDDFELPPMKTPPPKEAPAEEEHEAYDDYEEKAEVSVPEDIYDFDSEYSDSLDSINTENIILEDMSKPKVRPIRTDRENSARNIAEQVRMNDLAMDITAPVLDDLSDEYCAPEKKAESLLDKDKLEADEKLALKKRLQEDLGRRGENLNGRASKNMYNKLMEEKKLKIAKKGFVISLIPIVLGLAAAAICFFKMSWGSYTWFPYVAVFGVVGALLLLIKSKQAKMFGIILYAMTVLMYVGPGLVLYALNAEMQKSDDYVVHMVLCALAAIMNIISIIILNKNEAVNTYYTTSFSKKR